MEMINKNVPELSWRAADGRNVLSLSTFTNLGLILISFYSMFEKLIDYVVLVNIRILLV